MVGMLSFLVSLNFTYFLYPNDPDNLRYPVKPEWFRPCPCNYFCCTFYYPSSVSLFIYRTDFIPEKNKIFIPSTYFAYLHGEKRRKPVKKQHGTCFIY